jgi:Flp pilus assembly pilin Flp
MRTLVGRFVRGESGVTAYGLIAAALVLIGVGAWVVAPAPVLSIRRRRSIH